VNDVNVLEDPFSNIRIGQTVTARIVSKAKQSDKRNYQWELSLKPKMVTGKEYMLNSF
jgi:rRNA biogenesis protein RRP5